MTSRYYPSFALLTRALHPVMTVSTNARLKLGLLHHLFPFSCHAINGRKTHAVCCRCSSDISLLHKRRVNFVTHALHISFPSHLLQPPHSSSRSHLLFILLLAPIVQAHTSVHVCSQYNERPTARPLDEIMCMHRYTGPTIFWVYGDQENIVRYDTTTGYLAVHAST
ncbi:hypothetical protein F5888DRAFT_944333 [Russula emetica]|nr:hypothetical protein F5888DRAFT_944333 [Russula emetica]